ncbi:Uncharacterised protein [uncultured archaeon]|nr:Uncharacterised protein [uncultured archaeon]
MNSSATPFYTTTTNPYNLTLNLGESKIITWLVDATGNFNYYTFFVYANKTSEGSINNITNSWNVTIINGTLPDSIYPIFSNYYDNNGVQAGLGRGYFNTTVANTNGTVWFVINNTNIIATNTSANVYNVSYNFTSSKNYTYSWYAYGNGNLTNLNNSAPRNYNVSVGDIIPPSISILSPLNFTYRINSINFSFNTNKNASWCGYSLDFYPNITISSTNNTYFNFTNSGLSDGSHTIIFSCNDSFGNLNSTYRIFGIDTIPPHISFNSPINKSYSTRNLSINLLTNSDGKNLWFNRGLGNETYLITIIKLFNEGTNIIYAYANDSVGNLNSTNVTFFIDSTSPLISVNIPEEKTYTTSIIFFNITTNEDSYCWIALNSTNNYTMQNNFNRSFNYTLILPDKTYSINYYCNDSLNNLAVKTVLFGIKTVPPQISLNSPAADRYYRNSTVQFNYTPMASDGISTCELWGNFAGVWSKNNSTTNVANYSANYFTKDLNDGTYQWNIWCNNTLGANDWSTQGNITFIVDRTPPGISFIYPLNISYNTSIVSVELANTSEVSSLWWYNGSNNLSYDYSTDFMLLDGTYNYIAYANDSAGNLNQTSVIFNVDTSHPQFFNFSSNNASLIGSGVAFFNITANNTNGTVILNINGASIYARSVSPNVYSANYTFSANNTFIYNWTAYSNGTSCLQSLSPNQYYTINNTDVVNPNATLLAPENNSYLNNSINFTANLSDITPEYGDTESGIKNATLNVFNSSNDLINRTTVNYSPGTITTTVGIVVTLVDGVYKWFYNLFDFAGNSFVTENRTVTKDITPPLISITSPENNLESNNGTLIVSYTVSDINLDSCWYDDEGYSTGNILENCKNISEVMWIIGQHNVTVYANDSSGNVNNSLVRFSVDVMPPFVNLDFPSNNFSDDSSIISNVTFNCSVMENKNLKNISLYITDGLNNSFILNETKEISGESNFSSWTLTLPKGNYTWSCMAFDSVGNQMAGENYSLILNYTDLDEDNISDRIDNLYGRESNVVKEGVNNLNITISGNSTYGSYNDTQEIAFFDSDKKIMNFTHNFSLSKLDLNKVVIKEADNSLIVNLSDQLQMGYSKVIYINDNDFVDLCVKDSDLTDISQMSDSCTESDETNFSDCIGNNLGIIRGSLSCFDEGSVIRVENLRHSAIRGTVASSNNEVQNSNGVLGGGGSGGSSIKNKTIENNAIHGCLKNEDCKNTEYCFKNKCYTRECTDNSQCTDGKSCWEYRCVKLFDIKILDVSSTIGTGNFITFTYFLKGMANINNDVIVDFWLEKDGQRVTSGKDTIFIGNMEEKTEKAKLFIAKDTPPGRYELYVSVTYEKYSAESHRQIEIDKDGNVFSALNNIFFYIIPLLLILIFLLLIIVIKLEKKKIRNFFEYEEEWILTHRIFLAVFYLLVVSVGVIFALGFFGIISLPLLSDYIFNIRFFVKYVVGPYLFFIILVTLAIIGISIIMHNKMKKDYSGGAPARKNYLEHALKKISRRAPRSPRNAHQKINLWRKKGYDVDLLGRNKIPDKDKIEEWRRKGYDVSSLEKNSSVQKDKLEEWRKKGYDVDSLKRR